MGIRTLCLAALAASMIGCSGSSASGAPAALGGEWMVWLTFNGQEMGPFATCFTQTGTAIDGVGISGTVNGSSFTVTNDDLGGLQVVFTGIVVNGVASGSLAITGSSVTGTFRMQPFDPVGTLNMTGTVGSVSIAVAAATASGRREYSDVAKTQLENLEIGFDDGDVRVHLTFEAANFALGTLTLGAAGIATELSYETDTETVDTTVTGGSVTVTRYDGAGMAGTYTLQFGGNTITGDFDVAWDLEAYSPP